MKGNEKPKKDRLKRIMRNKEIFKFFMFTVMLPDYLIMFFITFNILGCPLYDTVTLLCIMKCFLVLILVITFILTAIIAAGWKDVKPEIHLTLLGLLYAVQGICITIYYSILSTM